MANVRYDHVTMFTLYLPLAVFSFSVKLSSFTVASKARISLHYSHLLLFISRKHKCKSRLPFAVNAILNLSTIDSLRKVNATRTLGYINALCAILVLQVLKTKKEKQNVTK